MAKELPYFKFEPSEWDNGNIQMCSLNTRAIFIDLCCIYWTRVGDLPYDLALQKICGGNNEALDELDNRGIIKLENELISIKFLDDQLSEFSETRAKNSANAKKRCLPGIFTTFLLFSNFSVAICTVRRSDHELRDPDCRTRQLHRQFCPPGNCPFLLYSRPGHSK